MRWPYRLDKDTTQEEMELFIRNCLPVTADCSVKQAYPAWQIQVQDWWRWHIKMESGWYH